MHERTEPACPVLSLAREFEEAARQNSVSEERDFDLRMSEIAEAASYLSSKSTAGAAFQIMCVAAEIDLLVKSADEPHVRKATERRIERLLYRSLEGLRSEASEFPNARAYMMAEEFDPKMKIN
jgi:hypothetical protein